MFGLVAIFVAIPGANLIYAVLGLVIFGGVHDLRLQPPAPGQQDGAVPIAAGIFLDVFNVFLFFLPIFGGGGSRR